MLSAIIVDDEVLSIKMMENILDWDSLGIRIVGTAQNGLEALNLCHQEDPNIIITDIKMPNLNGLEFIKKARVTNPGAEFILISAYADFDYVKRAIELGCSNYILKPVDEFELEQTLKKIIAKISDKMIAEKNAVKNRVAHDKQVIYRYMSTGVNPLAAGKSTSSLNLNLSSYTLFSFNLTEQSMNDYIENGLQLDAQMAFIMERMSAVMEEFGHCVLFDYKDYAWTAILSGDCSKESLSACASKMIDLFAEEIHMKIHVCFSPRGSRLDELPHLYRRLAQLSRFSSYIGDEEVLGYGYNMIETTFQQVDLLAYTKRLAEALNLNDAEEAARIIEEVLLLSCKSDPASLHLFIDFNYNAFCAIREKLIKENRLTDEYHEIRLLSYRDISDISTADEMSRFMNRILQLLSPNRSQTAKPRYSALVEVGIRYLGENYDRNLSLEEICTELSVSKNYFSYLFKRETGWNLWAYLTEIRLNKSKELLRTTDCKSYEIAYMVGYDNPSYFSKLFKKNTGMTPNEYRAENQ